MAQETVFGEILSALRPAFVLLAFFTLLTGLAYPAVVTAVAQVAAPGAANGSLIERGGKVIGSRLIAQGFAQPGYFHPRPSAAGKGYDASASAGTNLAPGSKDLRDAISARIAEARADGLTPNGLTNVAVPPDLVTTSASGLDPDLNPEAAFAQIARVAKARGRPVADVTALVREHTAQPLLGLIGEPTVNVLELNLALDRTVPNRQAPTGSRNSAG